MCTHNSPLGFKGQPSGITSLPVCGVMFTYVNLSFCHTWPLTRCPLFSMQEESEPQRQQEEGQPEGPAASRPLDPPRGDGDEKHGESPKCYSVRTRFTHPAMSGPPPGRTQPIREPDWQQEQPFRCKMSSHLLLL